MDAQDRAKGNTALHLAVIHCHNEAYRYLVSLGAKETIANDDGLTPLQLAAKLGHRCLQLPLPADCVSSQRPALVAVPTDPGAWSGGRPAPFVFEFVLKLRQRVGATRQPCP